MAIPCIRNRIVNNHHTRKTAKQILSTPLHIKNLFRKNNLNFPDNGEVIIIPTGKNTLRIKIAGSVHNIPGNLNGGWGGRFERGSYVE